MTPPESENAPVQNHLRSLFEETLSEGKHLQAVHAILAWAHSIRDDPSWQGNVPKELSEALKKLQNSIPQITNPNTIGAIIKLPNKLKQILTPPPEKAICITWAPKAKSLATAKQTTPRKRKRTNLTHKRGLRKMKLKKAELKRANRTASSTDPSSS